MDTDIYTSLILLAIYDQEINQHYLRRYIKFIKHFKAIEPHGKRKKGFERHHIFPNNRCSDKFGKDSNNLVLLPLQAHFIAHWMLWKAFPNNQAMIYAFKRLTENKKYKSRITGKMFEKLRNDFIETAKANANKRVEDGTHHFLGGELQRTNANKRVEDGTNPFLDREIARKNNLKRVEDGTHPFLGGAIARATNLKRVEDGTHHLLGSGMTAFDLELGKCVRIPSEEYYANIDRYVATRSKQYKHFKLKNQML